PEQAALDGVLAVRTRDDAAHLADRLAAGPRRVLVIGGGFPGSEIPSACRGRDIEVTVAERGPGPLGGAAGGTGLPPCSRERTWESKSGCGKRETPPASKT
ncbi:hypothetical protein ADK78_14975, partial [Kitasatospora aureofaciens]